MIREDLAIVLRMAAVLNSRLVEVTDLGRDKVLNNFHSGLGHWAETLEETRENYRQFADYLIAALEREKHYNGFVTTIVTENK